MSIRIAAASSDGINIDQHFGHADTFYIFDAESDGRYRLHRISILSEKGGNTCSSEVGCSSGTGCGCHSVHQIDVDYLDGAKYVLASGIGKGMEQALVKSNITPFAIETSIDEAIKKIVIYENRLNRFK